MSWFEEQLKYRQEVDDENFQKALDAITASVMGHNLSRFFDDKTLTQNAIEEILKYYQCKTKIEDIPSNCKTIEEQLEYIMRPLGIMRRNVELDRDWYNNSTGAMLASIKESGTVIALIPNKISGYSYFNSDTGKRVKVTKKVAEHIGREAICFYQPLPLKAITIKHLGKYIYKQLTFSDKFMTLFIMALTTALGMATPKLTQLLFGPVLNSGSEKVLLALIVFMICFGTAKLLFSTFQQLINARINVKISMAVQAAVMNRILSLPSSFFKEYSSGELSQRASYIETLCNTLVTTVTSTGLTFVFSFAYIGQIMSFAPSLSVTALVVTAVSAIVSLISALVQMNISRQQMLLMTRSSGLTYSTISGIQKIKLAGAQKRMFSRWASIYAQQSELAYNPPRFIVFNNTINLAVSSIGLLIMYYVAFTNNVNVADYYAFNASYGMITAAITSLTGMVLIAADIKPILEMSKPILEAVPEVSEGKETVNKLSGSIELSNVSFRYSDNMPKVIDNLSLKIKPGEYVAIVGSTGCGKSTLVRLLLGFETPQRGSIYYDRKDINKLDIKSLRKKIGVVMQNGKLFQDDIYSNIVISAPETDLDGAWEAARLAAIDEDIRKMPMGMNTLISDGQGGISGGQKQRLMIARALAPKPKIIILDEATSALDNITQKQVSDAIDSLNCTRIVIAHRLSTIRYADRILYLDKGKILEEGTYEELIAKNGLFAELVERQRIDM